MKYTIEIITGAGLVNKTIQADGFETNGDRFIFYDFHTEHNLYYDCDCMKHKIMKCSLPKDLTIINIEQ